MGIHWRLFAAILHGWGALILQIQRWTLGKAAGSALYDLCFCSDSEQLLLCVEWVLLCKMVLYAHLHHGTDDRIRSGQYHDFCKIRFGHFCPDDGSFRRDFDSADKERRQGDMGKVCRISAAFLFGSGHLYTFSGGNCFSVPPPACWKAHPCNGTADDRSSLHILHDDRGLFWCIHTTAGRRIY